MESITCRQCKRPKAPEHFYRQADGYTHVVCKLCRKEQYHLRQYRLTKEEYKQFLELQDNKCGICRKEFVEFERPAFVDHDHKTLKVRGLLCSNCNAGIGLLEDNPKILEAAIKYLEKN